jgi:hypothetical protein
VLNYDGRIQFNETNLIDNGSILKSNNLFKNIKVSDSYEVEAIKLDTYCSANNICPDILWIDVQGADLLVLMGAKNILTKIQLIYIEVSIFDRTHVNGCLSSEISAYLSKFGFECLQLGTDMASKTGNALFAKKSL